ncbi:MAG: endonuclease/exonuclease/phosphatase family protein [Bacteroidetes bacterium]|nr:endonuclease/exonuclease/phosphatase family protein [Bacteroidota bacterium]
MKKISLSLVIFFILVIIESCAPTKEAEKKPEEEVFKKNIPAQTVKILSVNAAHQLVDKTSVKKFADWLKTTGAEVISVQEIERPREGNEGFDAAAELAKNLDMRMFFGKARYYQGFDSGNALFSLYPIQQTNIFQLPTGKGKVRRSLTYGIIDTGLRGIGFATTELDDESFSERVKQSYEILQLAEKLKDYPLVISGMFGEPSNGKIAAKLEKSFSLCNVLDSAAAVMPQHIYVSINSTITPAAANKIKYNAAEAVLITLHVQQKK